MRAQVRHIKRSASAHARAYGQNTVAVHGSKSHNRPDARVVAAC